MVNSSKMIDNLKRLKNTGFFHIIFSQVFSKIISFCNSILIVRLITKAEYGLYSYSNNIISIFLLVNGLGVISGLLQFGSENSDNPVKLNAFAKLAWKTGLIFCSCISIFIILYAYFAHLEIDNASSMLLYMCFFPIADYIYSYIEIIFRIHLKNKFYSIIATLINVLSIVATVFGAYLLSINGIILFRYGAYIITILCGFYLYNKLEFHKQESSYVISKKEKATFFKLSFVSCINNAISQMLYLIDVFVIGLIIPNEQVIASYKTATTIPFALTFIPSAIMIYVYPYFAKHNNSREWVVRNYYRLLKVSILLNALISAFMFLFAPFIIRILFGTQYMDSVEVFRILSVGFFIAATFRIPSGIILNTLRRIKVNFFNSVFSGILNIILNYVLIIKMGSVGAAYSTVTIYIVSSFVSTLYLNVILINKSKPLINDR